MHTLLVLDLGLDVVDGVRRLHLKSDGLARQCLHKDLHNALRDERTENGTRTRLRGNETTCLVSGAEFSDQSTAYTC